MLMRSARFADSNRGNPDGHKELLAVPAHLFQDAYYTLPDGSRGPRQQLSGTAPVWTTPRGAIVEGCMA